MHAYVQRGLLGVLIAGGITLVGATAANADTPSHGSFGQQTGQSQSNEALNLGGNGLSLGSISAPITIAGNTLGGGSSSSSNPTTVVSSSDSSAKGASTIDQSNGASSAGRSGSGQSQSNDALNLGGNAVSGPTVSVPITVSGNTVGGSQEHKAPHGDSWQKPSKGGSSSSNPTTVVSSSSSTAKGSSTIDQSNVASSKGGSSDGWKQEGSKSGQTQSNEATNLGGNAVSGPAISLPITVAGNTVTGDQGRKHESSSTSTSNPTTVVSVAGSSAKGSSVIDQSNTASSKGGDRWGWKQHSGTSKQTQSNEATNLGGNGLSLGSLSAPVTISGNTLGSSSHGESWKPSNQGVSTSNPTTVVSTSSSSAKGASWIDQSNVAGSKSGDQWGWKKDSGAKQTQSNEATNLGGNGVSLGSLSAPITVAGNTVTGDQGRKHESGTVSSSNPTTVVSTSSSTAKGSSVIDQSDVASSKSGSHDGWKQHSGSTQTQSNEATNLGGNGLSLGSLSAPITIAGNTLGGHGGSSSNPTTVLSGSSSTATGSSWIGQWNGAHRA